MGRRLGRGLDDLLDDNDVDLPFLSSYGEASGEHLEGRAPSSGGADAEELHAAIQRHLGSGISTELKFTVDEEGVIFSMSTESPLPLVPSDLSLPGFEDGELSSDRCSMSVLITAWGVETRRLLDRMVEFLNPHE